MKNNKKNILIIFIIACIVIIPLFINNTYIIKDDSEFHISNILSTISSMKNYIPSDILPNLLGNYGIALRQFYPILSHTFVAYFSIITKLDVTICLKLTHLIVLFLSSVTMYYLSLKLSKDKKIALTSSIIYMLFPYHLNEIYIRDALGEHFIFIFLPMIIHGLLYLFEDKKKFLLLFCTGYIFGMLSHLTLMIYFTFCLIPFFIIYRKKVFNKKTISTLIIAALIIILINLPNIVNLFQNKLFGDYRVFTPYVMAQKIEHDGLLVDFFNYFGVFNKLTYNDPGKCFYFDIVVLFMLIILIKNRKKIDFKNYKFIIVFCFLTLFMSSIIFPWDLLPVSLRIIQFPWRIVTFYSIAIALLAPCSLKYIKIDYKYLIIIMVVLALVFHTKSISTTDFDINTLDYEKGIGWQKEYLSNKNYNNLDNIKSLEYKVHVDDGQSYIIKDEFPNITFEITEDSNVVIPRIYYFGYELIDKDNNKYNIYDNDYGLISANLKKGTYQLKYVKTRSVIIAQIISLISIIVTLIYILVLYKYDKKR